MTKKRPPSTRYKNPKFLKALGHHCNTLRKARGMSIDQMYREGEHLRPETIRKLEHGESDVKISFLFRYAQALGLEFHELFTLELNEPVESIQKQS